MKKYLIAIILSLLVTTEVEAQRTSNFFNLNESGTIFPANMTDALGDVTNPVANGYFTNLTVGSCTGCGGGGSGVFPFSADTNYGQVVYSTTTPTLWFKNGLFASTTSYLKDIIATGYVDAPYFTATSTTANGFAGYGGSATFPTYSFNGDSNTGMYSTAADQIMFSAAGANRLSITTVGLTLQSGSSLLAGAGTVSLPIYSFSSDTNTGIYSPGADAIGFTTSGSERLRIDSTGNIGIGTASPASKIHGVATLSADTGNEVAYQLNYTTNKLTSGNDTGLQINQTDTASPGTSYLLNLQSNSVGKFSVSNAGAVTARGSISLTGEDGSYPSFNITSYSDTGWHGVFQGSTRNRGTASAKLAVASGDTVFSYDMWGYDGTSSVRGAQFGASVDGTVSTGIVPMKFTFATMNQAGTYAERMRINRSGNVGIGTTSPYAKLSVVGEVVGSYFTSTSTSATSTFAGAVGIGTTTIASANDILTITTSGAGITTGLKPMIKVLDGGNPAISAKLGVFNDSVTYYGGLWFNQATPDASNYAFLASGNDTFLNGISGGNLYFRIGNSTKGILTSAGNFGIGTTSPYAKLSVVGETVSSYFTATSTTATTTINGALKLGSIGTSPTIGNATLVAGVVTVTTGAAVSTGFVNLTRKTIGGTIGTATYTIGNGSFTITSTSASDTSTFTWLVTH